MKNDVINQWNLAAEKYARAQINSPFAKFNREYVKRLVNDIGGKKVLDAGCGDGYYSEYFRQAGAFVTACDGSQEMVKAACSNFPDIQFDQVDLQNKWPYPDEEFDLVFCNLVLMDIQNIETMIAESSRVLKPGGSYIFSILHPCFYHAKWETDRLGRKTYRKIYDYLSHQTKKSDFWGETIHYHRPLSYYLNLMAANGLFLERLYEPAMPEYDYNAYQKSKLTKFRISLLTYLILIRNTLFRTQPNAYQKPSNRIPFLLLARMTKNKKYPTRFRN